MGCVFSVKLAATSTLCPAAWPIGLGGRRAHVGKDMVVARVDHGHLVAAKGRRSLAHLDQVAQRMIDATLDACAGRGGAPSSASRSRGRCTQRLSSALAGSLTIAVVVERADLVAQVDQRDAADAEDDAVDAADAAHGQLDLGRVAAAQGALQPGQRGQGAGDAGVAGAWVLLEGQAARKRALEAPGVKVVEKAAVVVAVDAQRRRVVVVKGPADVVVAAHVVDPGAVGRDAEAVAHRALQHAHLARGQAVPQQRHQQRVVGELAFVVADVLRHLVGVDDGLGLEEQAGRGDAQQGVEGLDQRVRLGQVLAARAHLLPDEGHRIQAQHLDPGVGQEEHLARHLAEDRRVAVVQVPLEDVEGRPDPHADLGAIGERARMLVGEDLAQRALVGVGHRAVGEDKVVLAIVRVAGQGALAQRCSSDVWLKIKSSTRLMPCARRSAARALSSSIVPRRSSTVR